MACSSTLAVRLLNQDVPSRASFLHAYHNGLILVHHVLRRQVRSVEPRLVDLVWHVHLLLLVLWGARRCLSRSVEALVVRLFELLESHAVRIHCVVVPA